MHNNQFKQKSNIMIMRDSYAVVALIANKGFAYHSILEVDITYMMFSALINWLNIALHLKDL